MQNITLVSNPLGLDLCNLVVFQEQKRVLSQYRSLLGRGLPK